MCACACVMCVCVCGCDRLMHRPAGGAVAQPPSVISPSQCAPASSGACLEFGGVDDDCCAAMGASCAPSFEGGPTNTTCGKTVPGLPTSVATCCRPTGSRTPLQTRMPSHTRHARNMCGAFGAHGQAASVHHPKPPFGLRLSSVYRGIPGIVCRERPSAAITCSLTRWLRVCRTLTPCLTHAHRSLPPRPMLPPAGYSMVLLGTACRWECAFVVREGVPGGFSCVRCAYR